MANIYNLLGETYYNAGNYEKALAAFKSSLKKNNNLALAYYNRGLTYYKTDNLSDAIDDLSKAVSLTNNQGDWYYSLASAYRDKKEYLKAVENYYSCIKLVRHTENRMLYTKKGFAISSCKTGMKRLKTMKG